MDDVLVGNVTIPASLKNINVPKISEQAPLSNKKITLGCCNAPRIVKVSRNSAISAAN